jgi:alcohol dehydrogenase (cytochrome c)
MKFASRWGVASAGAVVACAAAVGLFSVTASSAAGTSSSAAALSWALPGANVTNTRDVSGPITASNVGTLKATWSVPIHAKGFFGEYATTPVEADGVMYTQDLSSDVIAVQLSTGKVLWEHKYNSSDIGPNGVTVVDGTVYGATETSVFAIQAATGEQLWSKKITRNGNEGIDMAPGYNNGTVYVSTVPGNAANFYAGNGQAILWALNAQSGATKWKWDEVPANLWGNKKINSGGGQWDPPSFDSQGNLYIGVANPAPFLGTTKYPFGSSRPGADLYTDSVVKLNAKTGKLMWYYQLTPHDISDWDMNNSPVLTTINGTPAVIDAGKAGIVIALNQATGKLIWTRPVGVHIGPSNIGLLTAKDPSKFKFPITMEPGDLGGVESQLASNGSTVFAAINDMPVKYTGQSDADATDNLNTAKGELVAIDQDTGKILWDHKFAHSAFGAAAVTNNVVFTTTYDGTIWALSATTGKVLWSKPLSAGTNSPVMIDGNTVVAAGGFPQSKKQTASIEAFSLGGQAFSTS